MLGRLRDQRVLKTAFDAAGEASHTVYLFDSLELRRATFDDVTEEYERSKFTEVGYLSAHGVRLARLHYEEADVPALGAAKLHVFFELGDHLGSTSIVIDKATSELVERSTFQAYGGAESDYRPERWKSFREDYRFTGKEDDVEVGLQYFGKRYLNPLLGRWISADPLAVHEAGEADWNLYAYVSGKALKDVDPLGLDPPKSWERGIDFLPTAEAEGTVPSGPMPLDKSGYINGQSFRLRPVLSGDTGEVDYYVATHHKTHHAAWIVDNNPEDIHNFLKHEDKYAAAAGYYFGLLGRASAPDALTVRLVQQSLNGDLAGALKTWKAIWGATAEDPEEILKLATVTAAMAVAGNRFEARVAQAQTKLPAGWTKQQNRAMIKDPTKAGYRFTPAKGKEARSDGVRIDKGNKNVSLSHQQVDHVIVRKGGKVIGRDGKPLEGKIGDDPVNAHIPLSEWIKWKKWYSPD